MEAKLTFFVPGVAKPAGSKRGFYAPKLGRVLIVDDCKKSRDWKGDVKYAAMQAMAGRAPVAHAVMLTVSFAMPRPKSHYRTGRHAGSLRPDAPKWCTTKPDATKLLRCVEDAMTGVVWRDDAQVCFQIVEKKYDENPGAAIDVEPIPSAD